MTTNENQAAKDLIDKMRSALQRDGDFPASARVVNELRSLIGNPQTTANQITEIILREPSLGTRVLHLVNSSFYRRAKPIMTVSQAVVQVGMRPLAELCSGLILLQKFVPVAGRGGAFATCLQRSIVTALLASQFGKQTPSSSPSKTKNEQDEQGYLIGSFSEMGALLLAYYFPKMYESAAKRSQLKNVPIEQSIHDLTGLTPLQISMEVLDALNLPDYYKQILQSTQTIQAQGITPGNSKTYSTVVFDLARNLAAAQDVSKVISNNGSAEELRSVIATIDTKYGIKSEVTSKTINGLSALFKDHCRAIELNLPKLPDCVESISKPTDSSAIKVEVENSVGLQQVFTEINQSIASKASTATIITTVMETFAWSLNFDRVLLLLVDKERKKLLGRMALGSQVTFDPRSIERQLASLSRYSADLNAFKSGQTVFNGDPVLENGWPITAIPIGFGDKAVGVIYADKVNSNSDTVDKNDQATINMLAELLNKSVLSHSES